jgi:hypothetical protein
MTTKMNRYQARLQSGQTLVLAVIVFPALLAVLGLALDGGLLLQAKRRMQAAADAAALAGTWEVYRGNSGLVETAARDDARLNGFNHDVNATVTVNNPPLSGAWAGNARYVEVIITRNIPATILRVVGRDSSTVRSRAVAGMQRFMDFCLLALDPAESGALTVAGAANVTAGCGMMVNSNAPDAMELGGGACVQGSVIGVTGGWDASGTIQCIDPQPETGVPPVLDPLAYLTPPPIPSAPVANRFNMSGGTVTLNPGLYQNGLTINSGDVTFNPGIYVIDGDLHIGGGATVRGDGVMFYVTSTGGPWGRVQIDGSVTADLVAPDDGPYEGVLIWLDRIAPEKPPGSFIQGTPGSRFEGALYFPSVHLTLGGTNNTASWTMAIADTIDIEGDAAFPGDVNASSIQPPTFKPMLVE